MDTQEKPDCKTGTECGFACISKNKRCIDEIKGPARTLAEKLIDGVVSEAPRQRGTGAGSASLTPNEVALLMDSENRTFLSNSTPKQIVERAITRGKAELAQDGGEYTDADIAAVTDALWQVLGETKQGKKIQESLIKKGSMKTDIYLDPSTGKHGKPNEARAKFILRRYVEQNGKDAYTGEPIDLLGSDLEHIVPLSKLGRDAEDPDNMVLISKSVNQRKGNTELKAFLGPRGHVSKVHAAAEKDPDYWTKKAEEAKRRQEESDAIDKLLAEKDPDTWQVSDVDEWKTRYYKIAKHIGEPLTYTKTRPRGNSGQAFPVGWGKPMLKAMIKAKKDGDRDRFTQLSEARKRLIEVANTESQENLGNVKAKASENGKTYQEYSRIKKEFGL